MAAVGPTDSVPGAQNGSPATVRVVVCGLDGRVYRPPAQVVLVGPDRTERLRRSDDGLSYLGAPPAGPYKARAVTRRFVSPEQDVLAGEDATVTLHLGRKGWPNSYRLGGEVFPFAPPDGLLAVAFPVEVPEDGVAVDAGRALIAELGLRPLQVEGRDRTDFRNAEDAIWLFRLPDGADRNALLLRARAIVRAATGDSARVGVPVDLVAGQIKVIDSRAVLRFRDGIGPDRIEAILGEAKARRVALLTRLDHEIHVVELPAGPLETLAQLERWRAGEVTVYAEPDIMAQAVDDAFPATDPDDTKFNLQGNLGLQGVNTAWRTLAGVRADCALGDPRIVVCTVDGGVNLGHPDVGGTLTDGTPQIVSAYDFTRMRSLPDPAYRPIKSHGMRVLGMIAARTDNSKDIAGIAPNTRQIFLERPRLTSVAYAEMLFWAGGFTSPQPPSGWPSPLPDGADVMCCAHGSNGLGLSSTMKDTFDHLALRGRGGLGTVVIYSAGNDDTLITGYRQHAAYRTNLAIANSSRPDPHGVERRDPDSNFGPEIAVCAQGTQSLSLGLTGPPEPLDGTSAAAPIVAAVVALMLSLQPGLTATQVRAALTGTAVQIDPANNDPVGHWVNGFSKWYGHGRLDAGKAVV
jgi:subtilisin family serine protease